MPAALTLSRNSTNVLPRYSLTEAIVFSVSRSAISMYDRAAAVGAPLELPT